MIVSTRRSGPSRRQANRASLPAGSARRELAASLLPDRLAAAQRIIQLPAASRPGARKATPWITCSPSFLTRRQGVSRSAPPASGDSGARRKRPRAGESSAGFGISINEFMIAPCRRQLAAPSIGSAAVSSARVKPVGASPLVFCLCQCHPAPVFSIRPRLAMSFSCRPIVV